MSRGDVVRTPHVAVNSKRNVAIDFQIIEGRLNALPLEVCSFWDRDTDQVCGERAVETLHSFHPYVPVRGICARHLESWKREHLLELSP